MAASTTPDTQTASAPAPTAPDAATIDNTNNQPVATTFSPASMGADAALSSALIPVEPAPVRNTILNTKEQKAVSATVRAIPDQTTKMPQKKIEGGTEVDQLRLMAEMVHRELVDDELIRNLGEGPEISANELFATSSDGIPTGEAPASERNATARSNLSAFTTQLQAYRENA